MLARIRHIRTLGRDISFDTPSSRCRKCQDSHSGGTVLDVRWKIGPGHDTFDSLLKRPPSRSVEPRSGCARREVVRLRKVRPNQKNLMFPEESIEVGYLRASQLQLQRNVGIDISLLWWSEVGSSLVVIENMNTLELRGRSVMKRSSSIEWCETFPREILDLW